MEELSRQQGVRSWGQRQIRAATLRDLKEGPGCGGGMGWGSLVRAGQRPPPEGWGGECLLSHEWQEPWGGAKGGNGRIWFLL